MKYKQYRFKFYLNASHYIQIEGRQGQSHPHTWEITLDVLKVRDEFIRFNEVEERVEAFLKPYQDAVLNEVEPFNLINPTVENCCEYFKDELQIILAEQGWLMLMISIAETPSRVYVISLLADESEAVEKTSDVLVDRILDEIKKGAVH